MWWESFYYSAVNQLSLIRFTDFIDIAFVTFLVYKALKFFRDTQTIQLLKGVVLLIVITQIGYFANLNTIYYILSNFLQLGVIALIIVFQPELRRTLEHVGRTTVRKWFNSVGEFDEKALQMIKEISHGAQMMSNSKTGALIVIENDDNVEPVISSGVRINAETTSELLENIFVVNTPLHDGAVIIRDNKIELAACVLPLSQSVNIRQELGTRHRAAIGISEESDAVAVVVSEETGNISIAHKGTLETGFTEEALAKRILDLLNVYTAPDESSRGVKNYLTDLIKRGHSK